MPLFTPPGSVSGNSAVGGNLSVTGTSDFTGATTATSLALTGALTTTDILTGKVTGNANPQVVLNANGRIEFGGGTDPVDVALFRDGSLRLHTINDFVTEGNAIVDVAGKGLRVKEGSNACMGTATLVAGEVTVATTAVTANSRIFLSTQTEGGTPGFLGVSARVAGTSFTVTGVATDTSVIAWMLVEPA